MNFENIPKNLKIYESFLITEGKIKEYENIVASISGGADSDIVLDLISKVDVNKKVKYVFFDTGLEYKATKEHIDYLEKKYKIKIDVRTPKIPIPLAIKKYGQPFLSKYVSEMLSRLQRHKFNWEDKSYEELILQYPKCKSALLWWTNKNGENSSFNINRIKYLKEFIILNPPNFRISGKCCECAKKNPIKKYNKENNTNLSITGIRKAEGGIRSIAYKTCFSASSIGTNEYRPIFWYKNDTKKEYEKFYNITNSKCYNEYGLKRTGCAGCPFGKEFENELKIIEKYEPKLYNAANNIFKESYDYMRKYYEFIKLRNL